MMNRGQRGGVELQQQSHVFHRALIGHTASRCHTRHPIWPETSMPAMLPAPKRRMRDLARLLRGSTRLASRNSIVLLVVALLSACSLAKLGGRGSPQSTVTLVVDNLGYADVNVYVVRSEGVRGARLGTVNGGATVTFKVRETYLQAGGLIQLQARAISGRSTWTSPTLSVTNGGVVKLDLIASGTTDLSRSQLYIMQ